MDVESLLQYTKQNLPGQTGKKTNKETGRLEIYRNLTNGRQMFQS